MRRFACSLIALSLLGVPRLARAHDPLDDVSGEDDPNAKNDDQPRSHRKERQEAELSREVQEREEAEFHLNQEKDEFLRDLTDVARTMGRHGPFTKTAMARFLRTVGVEVDAKDTRGNRVWRLPRLDQARLAFESHVGGRLDWDGE